MNISDRLSDYFNLSLSNIEKKLNLSNGYISNYKNGKIKNPSKLVQSLREMKLNPNYFLTGEGSPELVPTQQQHIKTIAESVVGRFIPFLDQKASAGSGKELLDVDSCDRFICIPDSAAREDMYAIKVEGDSMYPTLKNGDVVVCEVAGWHGDGIYVIKTREFAFVKRVILQPDGYQVISDNALYPPYQVSPDEDTFIVGKVCYAIVQM
ncbi:MAG TPA: hypothetical protein IAA30_08500 [Candidatus Treponema faecavium]|nr:hypothetical protein [Candidatus Treponema faecavium]